MVLTIYLPDATLAGQESNRVNSRQYQDSAPLHPLPLGIIALSAWLVIFMLLAIRLFRWE